MRTPHKGEALELRWLEALSEESWEVSLWRWTGLGMGPGGTETTMDRTLPVNGTQGLWRPRGSDQGAMTPEDNRSCTLVGIQSLQSDPGNSLPPSSGCQRISPGGCGKDLQDAPVVGWDRGFARLWPAVCHLFLPTLCSPCQATSSPPFLSMNLT